MSRRLKVCVDCVHSRKMDPEGDKFICRHSTAGINFDIVRGYQAHLSCETMRADEDKCGLKARHYVSPGGWL